MMLRLGVLGSTRGSHLLTLIEAIQKGQLCATIEIVISNKAEALILERAQKHHLNHQFLDPTGLSRVLYDQNLKILLQEHQVDLIVLVGYMRILSAPFVQYWENKIINIHPSLLPAFSGLMDTQVHQAVIKSGLKETGCTVHYVTEQVDAGPILLQKKCRVLPEDSIDSLKQRVQALEGEALIEAIQSLT